MSKAFTKDDAADAPPLVPGRMPLPPGIPNYVTPRGLALLREELQQLQTERARIAASEDSERARLLATIDVRLTDLETRLGTVTLVIPSEQPRDSVRFGAQVTVRTESGEDRRYWLVGVDEADAAHGRVAFIAPLARALIGHRVGEVTMLRTPRGEEELEIIAIDYTDPSLA